MISKIACLFFILGLVHCVDFNQYDLMNEDNLEDLLRVYKEWLRFLLQFPDFAWHRHRFPRDFPFVDENYADDYWTASTTVSPKPNRTKFTVNPISTFTGEYGRTTDSHKHKFSSTKLGTLTTNKYERTTEIVSREIERSNSTNANRTSQTKSNYDDGSESPLQPITSEYNETTEDPLELIIEDIDNITAAIIDNVQKFHLTPNKCNFDLLYLLFNIQKQWTIQMLDAAGKLPSGILRGHITWLGDYRECTNVSVPLEQIYSSGRVIDFGNFNGQYCSIKWNISIKEISVPLTIGICVPDSCSGDDLMNDTATIRKFLSYVPIDNKINNIVKGVKVNQITCQAEGRKWTGGDIAYLIILGIFVILLVLGTSCDIILNVWMKRTESDVETGKSEIKQNSKDGPSGSRPDVVDENTGAAVAFGTENSVHRDDEPLSIQVRDTKQQKSTSFIMKFLLCFSAYTNGAKIFKTGNETSQLDCLHGIRFLSMSWVILGHTFFYALSAVGNLMDILEDINNFAFQGITQATFSVDSFFLLSGLLLSYLFLKECKKRDGKMNWIYYYIHRIWRLTPAFAMLLGFYATIWIHLGHGPMWPTEADSGNCRKTWWWNILYIQNFEHSADMCMGWTWYLANDMQFYIISPLFLIFLWKLPVIGISVISVLMISSWITTGILSHENNFITFLTFTDTMTVSQIMKNMANQANYFDIIYDKPYCRIGPYLIGALLGYILYKTEGRQKFMKWWMQIIGWSIALFFGLSVVYGLYHVHLGETTYSTYNTVSRSVWGIALGWVIYVCLTGHGGPVNTILSWKVLVPLSRLTYCAYLVHPMIMSWFYDSLQVNLYFHMPTMVLLYFGYMIFAYSVAFIASLLFESPLMALEKLILQQVSKKK